MEKYTSEDYVKKDTHSSVFGTHEELKGTDVSMTFHFTSASLSISDWKQACETFVQLRCSHFMMQMLFTTGVESQSPHIYEVSKG